jgi:hypothetical protein
MIALLLLTLTWHAPQYAEGSTMPGSAGCTECAVLYWRQRTGPEWWRDQSPPDTLAKLPASDGAAMGYITPLWASWGTCNVVCRDAAGNFSRPSNHVPSRLQ